MIFPAESLKTVTLQMNTLTLHPLDLELQAEKSEKSHTHSFWNLAQLGQV